MGDLIRQRQEFIYYIVLLELYKKTLVMGDLWY